MRRTLLARCSLLLAVLAVGCVSAPAPETRATTGDITSAAVPTTFGGTLRAHDPAVVGLPAGSRAALAQAPFPMLLLPAEYAAGSTVMAEARWAAVSYRGGGIALSIHATNVWHDGATDEDLAALPRATSTVHGHPAWETENEAVQSISWNEHDVAFAVEVECEDPEGDPRCADGAFVRDLAGRLVPSHDVQGATR